MAQIPLLTTFYFLQTAILPWSQKLKRPRPRPPLLLRHLHRLFWQDQPLVSSLVDSHRLFVLDPVLLVYLPHPDFPADFPPSEPSHLALAKRHLPLLS